MKNLLRLIVLMVAWSLIGFQSVGQEFPPSKHTAISEKTIQTFQRDFDPLYSQMSNPTNVGTNSQMYPDFPTYTCQAADDFVVPSNQTWFVESFEFAGFYSNGPGPVTMANLFVYANNAGTNSPGATIIEILQSTVEVSPDGQLHFLLAEPLVLLPGHYWISVQPIMSFTPNGQWFWRRQPAPTIGYEFHWQNPGGGFGIPNVLTWQKASLINFGTSSVDYNLSFAIYGEVEFTLTLSEGWSGISSYIIPDNPNLESMFESLIDDLVIFYNHDGMLWPGENINTLVNWNPNAGYVVKMAADAVLTFTGQPNTEKTVVLSAGLNIVHVPTECGMFTYELIEQLGTSLVYAQGIALPQVFIPMYSVDNLLYLSPGKAYYIITSQDVLLQFPECGISRGNEKGQLLFEEVESPWGLTVKTPASHNVIITEGALTSFRPGDFIGIFNQNGNLAGYAKLSGEPGAINITAFGTDNLNSYFSGMTVGEAFEFRYYQAGNGETFTLQPIYDMSLPDAGNFENFGLSSVIGFKEGALSVGEVNTSNVSMYPNPNDGSFFIDLGEANQFNLFEIINPQGQLILQGKLQQQTKVELNDAVGGIYFIRFVGEEAVRLRKVVINK